jgi:nucleotide-binding universal stress UspA family protein
MGFKKILCPTDFSAGSEHALRAAVRLAKDDSSELVVVHSWYVPPTATMTELSYPPELTQEIVDDAEQQLDLAIAKAKALGAIRVRGELLTGVPWAAITDLAERQGFDVCVIGTHGRTGLSRVLLGSVAEKVVRHAPCSVMVVHPEDKVKPFSHALIPFDFSPSSRLAIELAMHVIDTSGTITLLHVLQLPARFSGDVPMPAFTEETNKRAAELVRREVETLAKSTAHKVESRFRIGSIGHEIMSVLAEDPTYDLIALGSRGNTGIKRVLLGSIAEKTVRHAACPVLVARIPPGGTP